MFHGKNCDRHLFATPPSYPTMSDMWSEEDLETFIVETLKDLKSENEKERNAVHPLIFIMSREVGAELVWAASCEFNLPVPCKYMAMDLFNKYMVMQSQCLTEQVLTNSKRKEKQERMIKELERRVRAQAPLRALTCLMIASKLVGQKRKLNGKMLQEFMKKMELTYSVKQILNSEIRILKQLDYRNTTLQLNYFSTTSPSDLTFDVFPSSLFVHLCFRTSSLMIYNGMVIMALKLWAGIGQYQADQLHKASLLLLDIACLSHEKLYQELFFLTTGSRIIPENLKPLFARIVADRFLLAAATVVAAAWIIEGESLCSAIVYCINKHIDIATEDLESMAACLLARAEIRFCRLNRKFLGGCDL